MVMALSFMPNTGYIIKSSEGNIEGNLYDLVSQQIFRYDTKSSKTNTTVWVLWHIPTIPALGRWSQENQEFEVIPRYIASMRPV